MSEPDSKRQKMSETGISENRKGWIFNPRATSFEQVVKMEAFVDHTSIIKYIVEDPPFKFIVAPSRFCKSTNMDTVRSFLEIEVHKDGNNEGDAIRNVMNIATSIEELKRPNLKNYDLFCMPEPKCQILEDEAFVLKHFGRYPVIKLDFAVEGIESYTSALDHCLYVTHDAYRRHKYLRKSTRLDEDAGANNDAQEICKKWCSVIRYDEGDLDTKKKKAKTGIANLTQFLHSHFGRKVVLLVDEFDAIVSRAKFRVESDQELMDISNLVIDMLGCHLKGDKANEYVEYVFLTGVETISGLGSSPRLAGIIKYTFLEREEFVGVYGVKEDNVEVLVTKLKSRGLLGSLQNKEVEQIMKELRKHYNGYYYQNISVFSLWSVLHFLQNGRAEIHWTKPQVMIYIEEFLKFPSIAAKLLQLTGKKAGEETVLVKIPKTISVKELRQLVGKSKSSEGPDIDLALTYLKELGYLSNVKGVDSNGDKRRLKLANEEIRKEILETLLKPEVKIVGFDFARMQEAANVLCRILFCETTSANTFHKHLKKWYVILEKLFRGFESYNEFDINESVMKSVLTIALSKMKSWHRLASDHRIKDEEGRNLTSGRTDLWMKYVHSSGKTWVVIFEFKNRNSLIYKTPAQQQERVSLYALKEILGKEGNKEGYTSALKDLNPSTYLLVGLSMDDSYLPSISCLLNTELIENAICVSKTEFKEFPDYYKGYVNLL